jgi:hypothetical protein
MKEKTKGEGQDSIYIMEYHSRIEYEDLIRGYISDMSSSRPEK